MTAKKILIVLLTSGVAAAGTAGFELGVGAANVWAAAPAVQVVDAGTDPGEAAKLLNEFCNPGSTPIPPGTKTLGNCDYAGTVPTVAYSLPRTVGDAVYNCTPADTADPSSAYVEDSVEVSDDRSSSLTLSESVEASVTAGVVQLGLEFDSSQLTAVSTKLAVAQAVSIAPGEKGWIDTRVPEASYTATITDVNAPQPFQIQNLDFTIPGYADTSSPLELFYTGVHQPISGISPSDQSVCQGLILRIPSGAQGAAPSGGRQVTICRAAPAASRKRRRPMHRSRRHARRCTTRQLMAGSAPIRIPARTAVALVRGTRVYASGTAGKKRIVLHARRRVRKGRYLLVLSRRRHSTTRQVRLR